MSEFVDRREWDMCQKHEVTYGRPDPDCEDCQEAKRSD